MECKLIEHAVQECHVTSQAVVAVALANGAEMGVAVLATMACSICAPLNIDLTPEELLKDMQVRSYTLFWHFPCPLASAVHD